MYSQLYGQMTDQSLLCAILEFGLNLEIMAVSDDIAYF